MELKIRKEDSSDKLIKNMPEESWNKLKKLAQINGLTTSKMIELLVEFFLDGDDLV